MGQHQNLHELSVNVILRFTICMKSDFREWLFSKF